MTSIRNAQGVKDELLAHKDKLLDSYTFFSIDHLTHLKFCSTALQRQNRSFNIFEYT